MIRYTCTGCKGSGKREEKPCEPCMGRGYVSPDSKTYRDKSKDGRKGKAIPFDWS